MRQYSANRPIHREWGPHPPRLWAWPELLVTLGIVLDWAPSYYFGVDPTYYSGVKLLALPCILAQALVAPGLYLPSQTGVFPYAMGLALLAGSGTAALVGNIPTQRFVELVPIVPITLFYARQRPRPIIRFICQTMAAASLLAPLNLLLVQAGFAAPSQSTLLGDIARFWAGPSSSLMAVLGLVPAAALGGRAFAGKRVSAAWEVGAAGVVCLGLAGVLLTGQRALLAVYLACAGMSLLALIRRTSKWRPPVIGFVTLVTLSVATSPHFGQSTRSLQVRVSEISSTPDRGGLDIRVGFYEILLADLVRAPRIVAPGMDSVVHEFGSGTHSILGEAYFDGGILLLLALLWGFAKAAKGAVRDAADDPHFGDGTGAFLLALLLGTALMLSVDPGLRTRLVYVVVGVCARPLVRQHTRPALVFKRS